LGERGENLEMFQIPYEVRYVGAWAKTRYKNERKRDADTPG
jgi:hypothetical protein